MKSGSFVHDVNATDNDVMSNGEVKYAIMHGDEGKFHINATSGIITTAEALDRETKDSYTVTGKHSYLLLFKSSQSLRLC